MTFNGPTGGVVSLDFTGCYIFNFNGHYTSPVGPTGGNVYLVQNPTGTGSGPTVVAGSGSTFGGTGATGPFDVYQQSMVQVNSLTNGLNHFAYRSDPDVTLTRAISGGTQNYCFSESIFRVG